MYGIICVWQKNCMLWKHTKKYCDFIYDYKLDHLLRVYMLIFLMLCIILKWFWVIIVLT